MGKKDENVHVGQDRSLIRIGLRLICILLLIFGL